MGDWFTMGMFHAIAAATIVAAVATISFRSPVYCAIWFGMTLTGTAGLFLMAGAEFLAVATLVVYAGAILVTFLFVLMLSQPEGHTSYDRRSWEPMLCGLHRRGARRCPHDDDRTGDPTKRKGSPLPPGEGQGEGIAVSRSACGSTSPQPNPLQDGEGTHCPAHDLAAGRRAFHPIPGRRGSRRGLALRRPRRRGGDRDPRPRSDETAPIPKEGPCPLNAS